MANAFYWLKNVLCCCIFYLYQNPVNQNNLLVMPLLNYSRLKEFWLYSKSILKYISSYKKPLHEQNVFLETVEIRDGSRHNIPILGSNTWTKNLDKSILVIEISGKNFALNSFYYLFKQAWDILNFNGFWNIIHVISSPLIAVYLINAFPNVAKWLPAAFTATLYCIKLKIRTKEKGTKDA